MKGLNCDFQVKAYYDTGVLFGLDLECDQLRGWRVSMNRFDEGTVFTGFDLSPINTFDDLSKSEYFTKEVLSFYLRWF